jgi:hypothetical protein
MNFNRRKFLQSTGTLVLGGMQLYQAKPHLIKRQSTRLAYSLFTFFNVMDDDVKGTLSKVSAAGYKEIESAFSKKGGYYGMKPKEFKAMANEKGCMEIAPCAGRSV